jgi:hypothetical protein
MKKFLLFAVAATMLIGIGLAWAQPRTVSHDTVTTYTDNTPIEATKTVLYSVWCIDNVTGAVVQIANKVPEVAHPFNDNTMVKGRLYNFYGQTWLSTGESSANSPTYGWVLPLGQPKPMGGWVVTTP